jgi:hypothetical protein
LEEEEKGNLGKEVWVNKVRRVSKEDKVYHFIHKVAGFSSPLWHCLSQKIQILLRPYPGEKPKTHVL